MPAFPDESGNFVRFHVPSVRNAKTRKQDRDDHRHASLGRNAIRANMDDETKEAYSRDVTTRRWADSTCPRTFIFEIRSRSYHDILKHKTLAIESKSSSLSSFVDVSVDWSTPAANTSGYKATRSQYDSRSSFAPSLGSEVLVASLHNSSRGVKSATRHVVAKFPHNNRPWPALH